MNLLNAVSTIMTSNIITVQPEDNIKKIETIFQNNRIHHIPVVAENKLVGIVSKSDYLFFKRGFNGVNDDSIIDEFRLKTRNVKEIMTTGIAYLEPTQRIDVALEIFKENLFHAIPIVENGELVGIVTTLDVIRELSIIKTKNND